MKANGLARGARRIQAAYSRDYDRRMRLFNLGVILVALIVLMILIMWLSNAWMAFEKSLGHTF